METSKRTPTCPNCGAKFAHNAALLECNACGITDEVAAQGSKAIARWRKECDKDLTEKRTRKSPVFQGQRSGLNKRKNKHGRRGVVVSADHRRGVSSHRRHYRALSRNRRQSIGGTEA